MLVRRNDVNGEEALTHGWDLFGDMDRLFEGFLGDRWNSAAAQGWTPSIEVIDGENEFTVRAEIPGVDPKAVEVNVTDGVLTLSGEKKHEAEEKHEGYVRAERSYGAFSRSIALPDTVDAAKATAEAANGVLTLHLPKAEAAKPKKIDVQVK